jgi:hypothetical protein
MEAHVVLGNAGKFGCIVLLISGLFRIYISCDQFLFVFFEGLRVESYGTGTQVR